MRGYLSGTNHLFKPDLLINLNLLFCYENNPFNDPKMEDNPMVVVSYIFTCLNFNCVIAGETGQDQITFSGIVTDATTDKPLPGVNMMVKGTLVGTVTGADDNYSIQVSPF